MYGRRIIGAAILFPSIYAAIGCIAIKIVSICLITTPHFVVEVFAI